MNLKKRDLVSIIIVNWNGKHFLKKCLQSIYSQRYKEIEVIVVDNGSIDGSVEYIITNFPKVKVIKNRYNLGFAEGNNIGYKKSSGDYILFLNNDTYVTSKFLIELILAFKNDQTIGGAQSKIYTMEDKNKLDMVGSFFTPTGFLFHYGFAKRDSKIYNRQIDIYSAKGAAMMFRRDVLKKIEVKGEIFDSNYFAYFEETDLCNRVWMVGFRIIYVPKSIIYHKVGATSSKLDNDFIQYHSFKNRINSYIKNLELINLVRILLPHLILCIAISLLYLLRKKIKIFLAINKAIFWNIKNISLTIEKRNFIQSRIRKLDDDKFLPIITKRVSINYYYHTFLGNLSAYREN